MQELADAEAAWSEMGSHAGREDLDVRMLGSGRPFVLELADARGVMPLQAQLQALQEQLAASGAGVEVLKLQAAPKSILKAIKVRALYCCAFLTALFLARPAVGRAPEILASSSTDPVSCCRQGAAHPQVGPTALSEGLARTTTLCWHAGWRGREAEVLPGQVQAALPRDRCHAGPAGQHEGCGAAADHSRSRGAQAGHAGDASACLPDIPLPASHQ